jgi:ADP-dependent phosphofructokinase/glucokinase
MNLIPLPHVVNLNFEKVVPFIQELEISTPNYPSEILSKNIQEIFQNFNFSKNENFYQEGYEIKIEEKTILIKSCTEISILLKQLTSH